MLPVPELVLGSDRKPASQGEPGATPAYAGRAALADGLAEAARTLLSSGVSSTHIVSLAQNLALECKKIKGFATTAARFVAAAGGDIVLPGSTAASVAQPK